MPDRVKGIWIVAHIFRKNITGRENLPEKCISGTKTSSSVSVKAMGNLITIIKYTGHNAEPLSDQLPQTEWKRGNII